MSAKERVKTEADELGDKHNALADFFHTPAFLALSPEMRTLMRIQHDAMLAYLRVLHRRLEIWGD